MREMLRDLRGGLTVTVENKTLLDTHMKYADTPDALPDKEMTWQEHPPQKDAKGEHQPVAGWGHREEIHNLHPNIIQHLPTATHATTLYDPKRHLLHSHDNTVTVQGDEPEFHNVQHEFSHSIHKFNAHAPAGTQKWTHLHTDIIHSKPIDRSPAETGQQFSNRIAGVIEKTDVYRHNDMADEEGGEVHNIHHIVFDPLEKWTIDEERDKDHPVHIGYSGSHTFHTEQNAAGTGYRHGEIAQDFSHYIRVK